MVWWELTDQTILVDESGQFELGLKLREIPSAAVTITAEFLTGGDPDLTILDGSIFAFDETNWNEFQTITLAAADDADLLQGQATLRLSHSISGIVDLDLTVTEHDDDSVILATPDSIYVNEGDEGTTIPFNQQDETAYNDSPVSEGTFTGGTGHAVSDVLILSDGTRVRVDAVDTIGGVTEFTISSNSSNGAAFNDTLTQSTTTGAGTGFSLTLDTNNIGGKGGATQSAWQPSQPDQSQSPHPSLVIRTSQLPVVPS